MKFGVDAPWYNDPVERTAFNLYALSLTALDEIAEDIYKGNSDIDDYDLNSEERTYVMNMVERM